MPKYDAEYFIEKFSAIPESDWCVGEYYTSGGLRCAVGHCGEFGGLPATAALFGLFKTAGIRSVEAVNDGDFGSKFPQPTPRARILAALSQIRTTEKEDGR